MFDSGWLHSGPCAAKMGRLLLGLPCPYIKFGVMGRMLFLAAAGV